MEEWRDIPGYADYQASSEGRVRSLPRLANVGNGAKRTVRGQILRASPLSRANRYPNVAVRGRSVRVHVLVALAFHGPCPAGLETLHLDDNRANARAANLRYGTRSENVKMLWASGVRG